MTPAEEDAVKVARAFLEFRFGVRSNDKKDTLANKKARADKIARVHKSEPLRDQRAYMKAKGEPLGAEYDERPRAKGRKWWHLKERNLYIAEVVAQLLDRGFCYSRNDLTSAESVCSIVAKALENLSPMTENEVDRIWRYKAPSYLNADRAPKDGGEKVTIIDE